MAKTGEKNQESGMILRLEDVCLGQAGALATASHIADDQLRSDLEEEYLLFSWENSLWGWSHSVRIKWGENKKHG